MKYLRRQDLGVATRMEIALQAYLSQGIYGSRTRLATIYGVSRTFIYQQLWLLQFYLSIEFSTLSAPSAPLTQTGDIVDRLIFLLRLKGQCSLEQISDILVELGLSPHSIGSISARLKAVGEKLPSTLSSEEIQLVIF